MRPGDDTPVIRASAPVAVRDPLGNLAQVRAARQRPMSERLELALSWNLVASQLRAGLVGATKPSERHPEYVELVPAEHREQFGV